MSGPSGRRRLSLPTTTRTDRGWLLLVTTGLVAVVWLAMPESVLAHALGCAPWILIGAARAFNGVKPRAATLLLALGAAAVAPALAIMADMTGLAAPPPLLVIASTFGGVVAAGLAAWAAPSEVAHTLARPIVDGQVGRYRLVSKIGVGGMGEVWRAEHDSLARPAALKLIRWQRIADPSIEQEMLERFRKEAEVTAGLASPHTIVLYDFGVAEGGIIYYAMELLEGMSAYQLVERYGPIEEARCAFLLQQACHSLIEAHHAGLVHRDLKPENLFIAKLGRDEDFLKVLDFGLVKELDSDPNDARGKRQRLQLTVAGARPGTPGFMAPEQITGSAPIDQRADVYALGCVAYYLLTGAAVFHGKVAAQILFAHVSTEPDPPSTRVGRPLHAGLEAIVLTCLAKDPAARPTMEQLGAALGQLVFERPWSQERARQWWGQAARQP